MKLIYSLLLLGLALGQTTPASRKSDRELDGFTGPVRKVFEEWSPLQTTPNGIQPGTRCRSRQTLYDEQGREIQSSLFSNSCGEDEHRSTRLYDKDGNFTTKDEEFDNPQAPPRPPPPMPPPGAANQPRPAGPHKSMLKYDEKGRKVEKAVYFSNGNLIFRIVWIWDEQNREIEMQAYDAAGIRYSQSVYRYEGRQRYPGQYLSYDRNGTRSSKITYSDYEFNSRGDWIRHKSTAETTGRPAASALTLRTIEYDNAKK